MQNKNLAEETSGLDKLSCLGTYIEDLDFFNSNLIDILNDEKVLIFGPTAKDLWSYIDHSFRKELYSLNQSKRFLVEKDITFIYLPFYRKITFVSGAEIIGMLPNKFYKKETDILIVINPQAIKEKEYEAVIFPMIQDIPDLKVFYS